MRRLTATAMLACTIVSAARIWDGGCGTCHFVSSFSGLSEVVVETPPRPHNTDTNILEQVLNKYDCHEWQKF